MGNENKNHSYVVRRVTDTATYTSTTGRVVVTHRGLKQREAPGRALRDTNDWYENMIKLLCLYVIANTAGVEVTLLRNFQASSGG